jgi:hypothetical protein
MDSSPTTIKGEAIEVAVSNATPIPTVEAGEDEHRREYLPLWQLLPIFVAMSLGIFILGLASYF